MEMPLECTELAPKGLFIGEEQTDTTDLCSAEEHSVEDKLSSELDNPRVDGGGNGLVVAPASEERSHGETLPREQEKGHLSTDSLPLERTQEDTEGCSTVLKQSNQNSEAPPPPEEGGAQVKTSTEEKDETKEKGAIEEDNGRNKHGHKRVTFPSDDDIVSGALEPKDPWRHAQNVTVDEVITSYTQACQKLNCKQIPKLIRQLQELTDLSGRVDNLDLKGERLDHKACEALEEVFKRVQFKMVDLEQTNLDEDGASALFDMIEYYESATHLNISFNKHIGTRGWQAAAHMMRKTNCLQYLDARNTPLLDHSAPFVARALRISSSLTVLHLENCSLSGRPLMLLATALKMNIVLRELYLADNRLNSLQDSAQLGNVLKFNSCIQILDLRNNHIMDSGLAFLCEGIKEQRQGLVTLVLWNNQLTHTGMVYMSMCLPHTQTLETLNLGHNAIGNEGVRHLKNGLIGNRSVLRLGLASAKLTCEGAVAVAEFVAESPRLLRLDLRENEIKTGGLMALSLALRVNQSLLRLDLDREPKKEAVKSFIETQRTLLTEIQNGCRRNFVLAKEKEERLQHSVSMAEIACPTPEDVEPTPEESEPALEEPISSPEDSVPVTEIVSPVLEEPGCTLVPETQKEDSDSDTEEEEVEEKEEKINTLPEGPRLQRPTGQVEVSSPGRGHKVFLVTRVENSNPAENGKGEQSTGVKPLAAPSLSNGLESGQTSPNSTSKDTCDTYSDTELEDLLRDASTEPDPAVNFVTL
ncbi:protein phosphatase 1 regulatory subunit 37 isoform X2 [Bombina bombina]|uniref:protein phosphatase 1 regulatory subunit 37 isoform X2 n=1 Tax=Bombina bombina TaxID=8345 RepID=UPI00235B1773|nr:protein phosphatase 1 regulatory subunit 37 isoform X2 [Bombina bombina]XP_053544776.1 protein phosphatase 1 regulatory subunit 37 isoform X2 [Bombina bombina]